MKLFLVRHGASTGNTPGNLIGHSDHPLSERGEAQARAVAARLGPLGPMTVYTSDLPRALETAKIIATEWQTPNPPADAPPAVNPDPRLREIDLGDLEGGSWDDFTQNQELTAALEADPFHTPLPGGESLALLRERVIAAVDEIVIAHAGEHDPASVADIAAAHAADDTAVAPVAEGDEPGASGAGEPGSFGEPAPSVCLVAHDGPIRAIVNHYLGVPPEKWWVVTTTHGGLTLLEFSDGWVDLRFLNDTAHLAGVDYEL
jgi:broad specificity phosphatase PhoE